MFAGGAQPAQDCSSLPKVCDRSSLPAHKKEAVFALKTPSKQRI